jgi:hypothetical protein
VDFNITDQLLIRFSASVILEEKWEYNETVHRLFVDFQKAYVNEEGSILQYSYRVWNPYEISQDD